MPFSTDHRFNAIYTSPFSILWLFNNFIIRRQKLGQGRRNDISWVKRNWCVKLKPLICYIRFISPIESWNDLSLKECHNSSYVSDELIDEILVRTCRKGFLEWTEHSRVQVIFERLTYQLQHWKSQWSTKQFYSNWHITQIIWPTKFHQKSSAQFLSSLFVASHRVLLYPAQAYCLQGPSIMSCKSPWSCAAQHGSYLGFVVDLKC